MNHHPHQAYCKKTWIVENLHDIHAHADCSYQNVNKHRPYFRSPCSFQISSFREAQQNT